MSWLKAHPWLTSSITLLLIAAAFAAYTGLYQLLLPQPKGFDAAINSLLQKTKAPGGVVLAMQGSQIEMVRTYGFADPDTGRKVTPDTMFTIASISKPVTATALMTLYEQGRFGLDDDINNYLPFSVRNPAFPETPITFRMLLTHTSGIRDSDIYETLYTLGQAPQLPDSPIALGYFMRGYFQLGGLWYSADQNFYSDAPGANYHYSNIGFGLVGYLVERISGMPFEQYCRQTVFKPLGMTHTTWLYRDLNVVQTAVPFGYDYLRRQPKRYGFYGDPSFPNGALKTSAIEFARFLPLFLNGGKTIDGKPFLQPETVRLMLTPHSSLPEKPAVRGLAWGTDGDFYRHAGADPGVETFAEFNPTTGRAFVFFANGGDPFSLPGKVRLLFFVNRIQEIAKLLLTNRSVDLKPA